MELHPLSRLGVYSAIEMIGAHQIKREMKNMKNTRFLSRSIIIPIHDLLVQLCNYLIRFSWLLIFEGSKDQAHESIHWSKLGALTREGGERRAENPSCSIFAPNQPSKAQIHAFSNHGPDRLHHGPDYGP